MSLIKQLVPVILVSSFLSASAEVTIKPAGDRLQVSIDGQVFTEYHYTNVLRPFCYPVTGPGQVALTRNFPMKQVSGEQKDHPHHRSLWFAHGSVNGHDFWSEQGKFGRIVHRGFLKIESGASLARLKAANDWVTSSGDVLCQDERELVFSSEGSGSNETRRLDFAITLIASQTNLVLGDTKEGTMAIRIAESMRLKGGLNQGHIRNSQGLKDDATWGKPANWCDYYGPVDGQTMGITILDHPENPRHPTWWHVRDYGLFAANPFGKHDFEGLKDQPNAGNLIIKKGEKVTFRYRFVFRKGETDAGTVDAWFREFAKSTPN
jgi:hypothetical protein